jgi:hypothetical protein
MSNDVVGQMPNDVVGQGTAADPWVLRIPIGDI